MMMGGGDNEVSKVDGGGSGGSEELERITVIFFNVWSLET